MIEKTRLSWIGLSFLLTTTVGDHHFSHNEQIEHRMADQLQARSSDPWPGLLLIKEDFFSVLSNLSSHVDLSFIESLYKCNLRINKSLG